MNPEQRAVFDFVKTHPDQSVLITGPAGTGKTYLTRAIIQWFLEKHPSLNIGITGSTGNAAVLIQGRTLHSFLGIGLAKSPPEQLVKAMNTKQLIKLRRLNTLILDEVSMISAELMDIIDAVLRIARKKDLPFGGVRFIFIGDACQLPPVSGGYFFNSQAWQAANIQVFQLTTLVRQQNDSRFQELLSRARWGTLNDDDIALLKSRVGFAKPTRDDIKPTRLYAINHSVDKENDKAFNQLLLTVPSKDHLRTYKTDYYDPAGSAATRVKMKKYAEQARIPEDLLLCIGAQVMITWNQAPETGIVNGTRGVVCELQPDSVGIQMVSGATAMIPYMTLDYPDDTPKPFVKGDMTPKPYIRFMPIRLAYALSIHKSQGVTLDTAEIDLGESIFEYGQAYTALSRVKSLDALRLTSFSPRVFRTHPDVVAFYAAPEP